jgi:hypothetical protein
MSPVENAKILIKQSWLKKLKLINIRRFYPERLVRVEKLALSFVPVFDFSP